MVGTSNQSVPVAWPLTHHRFSCLIRPEVNLLLRAEPWVNLPFGDVFCHTHMAVGQNLVPLVNIKIAGKWMFIPLKMVLIGIDSHPYIVILGMISVRCSAWLVARFFLSVSGVPGIPPFKLNPYCWGLLQCLLSKCQSLRHVGWIRFFARQNLYF